MAKKIYDEVPFSRDYNYDKLTTDEANRVIKTLDGQKQHDKKYTAETVVKFTLLSVLCVLSLYILIFVFDWSEITNIYDNINLILYAGFKIFLSVLFISIFIKEIIIAAKSKKESNRFLIAKGNIVSVNETNIKPDFFHDDGIKVDLTVSVSDNETLPPFDITLYRNLCEYIVIGDPIIIIYFPKGPYYIYLYEPWYEK